MINHSTLFFLASFFLYLLFPLGLLSLNSFLYKAVFFLHVIFLLASIIRVLIKLIKLNAKNYLFFALLLALLSFIVCMNLLPITARDALLYHLAVPKWWISSGYISEISWHEWSHFPLIGSLAYTGLIQFGVVKLSGIYHFLYLVLTLGFLSIWFNKLTNRPKLSQYLFLFLLSIPLNLRLAYSPMADFILLSFFTIAFIETYNLIYTEKHCKKSLYLSFFFITTTKYSALLVVLCLISTYFVIHLFKSKSFLNPLRNSILFGLVSLLGVFPWLLKNYIYTKNPFFPFLKSFFGGGDNVAFLGKINPIRYRMEVFEESLLDIFLIPIRFFFKGVDNNPIYFDGVLTPILIVGILSLIYAKHRKLAISVLIFTFFYTFLSLNIFYALVRYQLPSVLLISVLLFIVFDGLLARKNKSLTFLFISVLVAVHSLHVISYASSKISREPVVSYLKGEIEKDKYLEERIAEYSLIKYINENLKEEDKVYLVLTGNKFYLYNKAVESEYFSANIIIKLLKENKSLSKHFKSKNFSHILINIPRLKRLLDSGLSNSQLKNWVNFFDKELKPLKSKGSYLLLKLI